MAALEMAPVLSMVALTSVVTSFVLPPDCSPGFYLESGDCKECPPGHFMDVHNKFSRCKHHRDCKKSENITFEGNSTRDRVCTCEHGGRDYYNYDEQYGYDCRRCVGGNVSQPVLKARYRGDVACCPPDHQAHRNNHGKPTCSREAAPQPPSSDGGSGTQDHYPPAGEDSLDKRPYIVGFTIFGLFIGGIVAFGFYLRHKRRSNSTNSARIAACAPSENNDRKEPMSMKSTMEYTAVPSE